MQTLTELRASFQEWNIDGLLITGAQNRRYVTGFTGTFGVVLISNREAKLITDFRYAEQAAAQVTGFEIVQYKGSIQEEVARQAEQMGISQLGYEEAHLTCLGYRQYAEQVKAATVPTKGVVEALRLIKSEAEIKSIKTAAQIADNAFTHILGFIRPGVTEREVSNELEFFMRKQGATSSAFDIIVASGVRGALPHGVASEKTIEQGEMVTLDFGALYQGYRSDITRTVAVGEPNEKLKGIYQIVLEALHRCTDGLKPGITSREADSLAREWITQAGYGDRFEHGTGHGVGLDIHEDPFLSQKTDVLLQAGMVITVEPGIYLPQFGGVRIEDDVLITADGHEVLTQSARELIIL